MGLNCLSAECSIESTEIRASLSAEFIAVSIAFRLNVRLRVGKLNTVCFDLAWEVSIAFRLNVRLRVVKVCDFDGAINAPVSQLPFG